MSLLSARDREVSPELCIVPASAFIVGSTNVPVENTMPRRNFDIDFRHEFGTVPKSSELHKLDHRLGEVNRFILDRYAGNTFAVVGKVRPAVDDSLHIKCRRHSLPGRRNNDFGEQQIATGSDHHSHPKRYRFP